MFFHFLLGLAYVAYTLSVSFVHWMGVHLNRTNITIMGLLLYTWLPDLSTYMRKRGSISCDKHWHIVMRERLRFWIGPHISNTALQKSYYTHLKALVPYLSSTSNWSAWKCSSPMLNYHDSPPTFPHLVYGVMFVTWLDPISNGVAKFNAATIYLRRFSPAQHITESCGKVFSLVRW